MSDSLEILRRKMGTATELKSVVRAMKALAASSIGQYERAVVSLQEYDKTVNLGLSLALRDIGPSAGRDVSPAKEQLRLVAFGSDQGLIGQFNEVIADLVASSFPSRPAIVWAIGDRLADILTEKHRFDVRRVRLPHSVQGIAGVITTVVDQVARATSDLTQLGLYSFHHRPGPGANYSPCLQHLFPLDRRQDESLRGSDWPTSQRAEILQHDGSALHALLREYIFVSLFRACAESLASENACRLSAMQRAEKNIDKLRSALLLNFHQLRQASIDEELFDVVAGFEMIVPRRAATPHR